MREIFVEKKFRADALATIGQANAILTEYESQGLVLTLRQLYYQFVARDLFPANRRWTLVGQKWVRDENGTPNAEPNYKWLGILVSDARLAGLIDWEMMEDRTRELKKVNAWDSPSDIVEAVARQYKEDLWRGQKWRPEVWIEKDALVGVIQGVCNELRVPYFACKGYSSQSAQYEAGMRFRQYVNAGQKPIVLHFGDHDPSGMDMTRDNRQRLSMFTRAGVTLRRLALTRAQIEQYDPPPNPAKQTDSRSGDYIAEFGDQSWELDALEPRVIGQLIRDEIGSLRDQRAWDEAAAQEAEGRDDLQSVSNRWDDVRDFVRE